MARVPSAIWVVDTKKEHIAVSEARKLGIPVIAILDTNCDPDEVTYPIPGNDDAIRSVSLLTRVVADAVADGLIARAGAADGEAKPSAPAGDIGAEEPLAEWELQVLEGKTGSDEAAANGTAANGTAANGTAANDSGANGTAANDTGANGAASNGTSHAAGADQPAAGADQPAAEADAAVAAEADATAPADTTAAEPEA
jgi:small subunit ribosomal protein S2